MMSTRSDANPGTAVRRPWWKRLLDKLLHGPRTQTGPATPVALPVPVKIKVTSKPVPKKTRVAVPIKVDPIPPAPSAKGAGSWQIYIPKEGTDTTPIQIVHSNRQLFAVIYQSKEGWLFWTGPKSKVFTAMGQGDVWTTPDPKIAAIVVNFIHSSRLPEVPEGPKKEKPKRR